MVFRSRQPDIDLPTDLTIWDWLFNSEHSPLNGLPPSEVRGYTNAITKERISYLQVKEYTTYLSTALLKKYGLEEQQTVALFSPNTIWYPIAMLGTLRAGGKISGASPAYNVEEMTYALRKADAKFLCTMPTSMEVALAAAKNAGIPQDHIFLMEGEMEGFTTMKQLLEIGKSYGKGGQVPSYQLPPGKKNKDVCGFLSFSSGTTGLPKAVMIAHQNVIGQCLQIAQITPSDLRKILAVLPLFHITGLVHGLHLPVFINSEVYMLPNYTMPGMLKVVTEYQIKELLLVPPILIRLVRDPEVDRYDLSFLRRFSSGAAPLSKEILDLLQKKFPQTGFKQGYGMTESCSCITAHPPEKYGYEYAHRVGTIVANTDVKIVDPETGRELGLNEPGEILARGPQITMGYLNNEKATRDTYDEDGFLHTGDIGKIDEEGLITITDRLKEMIKVKGIGVAPAEIEDLLLGHDKVEDVAVLGIDDEWAGERPKAYVVLKPAIAKSVGTNVEPIGKELIKYVQDKKIRHKWVVEIEFVDEIPKSASGKILRRILRHAGGSVGRALVVREDKRERARL